MRGKEVDEENYIVRKSFCLTLSGKSFGHRIAWFGNFGIRLFSLIQFPLFLRSAIIQRIEVNKSSGCSSLKLSLKWKVWNPPFCGNRTMSAGEAKKRGFGDIVAVWALETRNVLGSDHLSLPSQDSGGAAGQGEEEERTRSTR